MSDNKNEQQEADRGTVRGVDDSGSIMVAWDSGGSLNVLFGVDECRKVVE